MTDWTQAESDAAYHALLKVRMVKGLNLDTVFSLVKIEFNKITGSGSSRKKEGLRTYLQNEENGRGRALWLCRKREFDALNDGNYQIWMG